MDSKQSTRPDRKDYDIKIYAGTQRLIWVTLFCNLDEMNRVKNTAAVEHGFNIDDLEIKFKEI